MNPIVSLIPTKVTVSVSKGHDHATRHLYFQAKLPFGRSIRDKNGQDLGKLEWEIQIAQSSQLNDHLREHSAIGSASFVPEVNDSDFGLQEAGFCAWAALDDGELDTLIEAISGGAVPGRITLQIAGLEYGWEPDGSGKIWDTEEGRNLLVTDVTIVATPNVSFREEEVCNDDMTSLPAALATSADIQSLQAKIVRIEDAISLAKNWAVLLGVAIIAAILLAGCSPSSATYEQGRSDGRAVGYNTACEIRATMIEGDWESAEYARGYADGVTAGIMACNDERRAR